MHRARFNRKEQVFAGFNAVNIVPLNELQPCCVLFSAKGVSSHVVKEPYFNNSKG